MAIKIQIHSLSLPLTPSDRTDCPVCRGFMFYSVDGICPDCWRAKHPMPSDISDEQSEIDFYHSFLFTGKGQSPAVAKAVHGHLECPYCGHIITTPVRFNPYTKQYEPMLVTHGILHRCPNCRDEFVLTRKQCEIHNKFWFPELTPMDDHYEAVKETE